MKWVIFPDAFWRYMLVTLPDERVWATGCLDACKAAGRLFTGGTVGVASAGECSSRELREQADREVFGVG